MSKKPAAKKVAAKQPAAKKVAKKAPSGYTYVTDSANAVRNTMPAPKPPKK